MVSGCSIIEACESYAPSIIDASTTGCSTFAGGFLFWETMLEDDLAWDKDRAEATVGNFYS